MAESTAPSGVPSAPPIGAAFWLAAALAAVVAETGADAVDASAGLPATTIGAAVLAVAAVAVQLRRRPGSSAVLATVSFWVGVALVGLLGTLLTDDLVDLAHASHGLAVLTSAAVVAAAVSASAILTHRERRAGASTGTTSGLRWMLGWVTLLGAAALGTAASDLAAAELALGTLVAVIVFAAVLGIVAIAYGVLDASPVLSFWAAFVLVRPLGAALGDLAAHPIRAGGLGIGAAASFAVALVLFAGLAVLAVRHGHGVARGAARPAR